MQLYKRGNVVKLLPGATNFGNKDGKEAIIEGSYKDLYGGEERDNPSYSVVFADTGDSLAWVYQSQMEFIRKGGEHLFDKAKKKRDKLTDLHKTPDYIRRNFKKGLNSDSILFLFELIGYKSRFLCSGEFYQLFSEWEQLRMVFVVAIFGKSIEFVREFEEEFQLSDKYNMNIESVYNFFHTDGGQTEA